MPGEGLRVKGQGAIFHVSRGSLVSLKKVRLCFKKVRACLKKDRVCLEYVRLRRTTDYSQLSTDNRQRIRAMPGEG